MPAILERLRELGVDIDRATTYAGWPPARPRPAARTSPTRWSPLGVVADRNEAFERLLGPGGRRYVGRYAAPLEPTDAGWSSAAGGVTVVAHPWGRHGHGRCSTEAAFAGCATPGLAGIEVDHQDHDAGDARALRAIARNLDLVVTGSSDYHGTGKVDHDLGCNTTAPEEYDRLLDAGRGRARRDAGGGRVSSARLVLLTEVFVTLFVIMDPLGTIPIFLSLTRGARRPRSAGPPGRRSRCRSA